MWLWLKAVVSTYFRHAPLALGGWEGAESADICSQITTMPSVHWMSDLGAAECVARIDRRVDGWATALVYLAAILLAFACIWRLPEQAVATAVVTAQLCAWLAGRCGSWVVGLVDRLRHASSRRLDAVTDEAAAASAAAFSPYAVARPPEASAPSPELSPRRSLTLVAASYSTRGSWAATRSPAPITRAKKAQATRQRNERNCILAALLVRLVQRMRGLDPRTPVGDVLREYASVLDGLPTALDFETSDAE